MPSAGDMDPITQHVYDGKRWVPMSVVVNNGETIVPVGSMSGQTATSRVRSFIERYVIERAGKFTPGHEKEDAWEAAQDARSIYDQIGRTSEEHENRERARQREMEMAALQTLPTGAAGPFYAPNDLEKQIFERYKEALQDGRIKDAEVIKERLFQMKRDAARWRLTKGKTNGKT